MSQSRLSFTRRSVPNAPKIAEQTSQSARNINPVLTETETIKGNDQEYNCGTFILMYPVLPVVTMTSNTAI